MDIESGWFPDPLNPENEIYFDGTKWTGEKRPRIIEIDNVNKQEEYSFSIPIPNKYLAKNRVISFFVIIALVISGVTFLKIQSDNAAKEKASIARAEKAKAELDAALALERIKNDVTWVPSGYKAWNEDKSIAWKWGRNSGNKCGGCSYWIADVISKYGCLNGLYGELNITKYGTVIAYTNDSLGYLSPLQAGQLIFETYEEGNIQGTLTELNCR
ncbi:Domain of unknown function DUF2510 [Candidatus Nanopelagicaceae bacterium]